jgi:hypothetical protein
MRAFRLACLCGQVRTLTSPRSPNHLMENPLLASWTGNSVNVNEEQWTLCFMDDFESRLSLRSVQGRAMVSKFDECQFVPPIGRPAD